MPRRALPLLLVLAALLAVPAAAGAVTADYYPLPGTANAGPIAAGPDGTVWWAGESGVDPVLGRLLPAAASPGTSNGINALAMPGRTPADTGPCCVFLPRSMTVGKDGTEIFFTRSDGILGKASAAAVNANSAATAFTLQPVPGRMDLGGIALGPQDTLWFSENGAYNVTDPNVPLGWPGNRMSYATTGLGITQLVNIAFQSGSLASIRYDAGPSGVAISPDGEAWFTEADSGNPGYRVARVSPTGNPATTYTEYQLPCVPMASPCSGSYTDTGPVDLAFSPDKDLWYTNQVRKSLGRLDANRTTFTEYSLASIDPALANGKPADMASAQDGTVWFAVRGGFSAPGANALVRIAPGQNGAAPTSTVYPLGSGNDPASIAVSPTGDVWFSSPSVSGGTPGRLGRLAGVVAPTAPAGGGGSPTPAPTPGATPLTPTTRGQARVTPPVVKGPDVLADQICVGPVFDRCSLVYIISAGEYVTGFPGARSAAKRKGKAKPKPVILARKAVTLKGGEKRTIRITLNKKGKALLKKRGKLSVYFTATQAAGDGKPAQVLRRTKLTLKATAKKKPKKR